MMTFRLLLLAGILSMITNPNLVAQNKLSVFTSAGYTNHLNRNGINWEIGLDYEIFKRLDVSTALRYNYMNRNDDNKVIVNNISFYISFIIINKNSNRLLIGPGFSHGKYSRHNDYIGFEKEYTNTRVNPVRIQYDYTFSINMRIGAIVSLYGDDGDGTEYFGLLLGYKF